LNLAAWPFFLQQSRILAILSVGAGGPTLIQDALAAVWFEKWTSSQGGSLL